MIPFSVLDLSPINQGSDAAQAFQNSKELAQHAERLGYQRYWLAEHHNMPGIASAATSVVIGHIAAHTSTIRVGAGGIMLPNHSPLVIAEQFGTLESLFPGRIDLGLGRAPGSDQRTARALRRNMGDSADSFPQDVVELLDYFKEAIPYQAVRAVPGAGLKVPVWLLGSSLYSAQMAAELGLPFAFASHFAPGFMQSAIEIYRTRFKPSETLARPHVMLGLNVFAADSDDEARRLFTSLQQQFVNLVRGVPGQLAPPLDHIDDFWRPDEKAHIERSLSCSVVGSPDTVARGLQVFIDDTGADELMITAQMYDHAARLRSFGIVSEVRASLRNNVKL
ncbi:LLM class flavin-dependent oxidoreductase [Herbaspirillum autotrophicum]|uniref:LLM class flavin-dependent oxidoreductase n=1 Tax=Herbaspirillum autotrophicum TaxID=180195 RepID=UPI00067D2E78|nr:LLM class flavin-dependent oxidoreductase [Herbaspirillum autotrophicum]